MLVITSFEVKNNLCFVKILIEVLFRRVISNKQCYWYYMLVITSFVLILFSDVNLDLGLCKIMQKF
jgi:hypothetical protein